MFVRWFTEHDTTCALAAPRLLPLRHGADGGHGDVAARRPPLPPRRRVHAMKLANHGGRAALVLDGSIADVHEASGGRFGPDPMGVYDDWPAFVDFAAGVGTGTAPLVEADLRCPVPAPRQVFAIGLNYRSHAEESGMAVPDVPATFTKFPASLCGPVRRHRDRRRHRRLGGRARGRDRHPRRPGGRGRRLVARRRPHRGPGHQRPHPPVRRRRPVLARQVPPGLRADGARGWSRSTRCPNPTTSPSAARSTARRCRTHARPTSSSACPG